MHEDGDVLIVGGGLVGACLALALDRAGIAATLVEARPPSLALADPLRERYLALARASLNALAALGIRGDLEPQAEPIRAVHVSRRGDFGRVLLRADDHGVDRFGAVVPASRLGQALETALQRCTLLRRVAPARLLEYAPDGNGIAATIEVDGGERQLHAAVVVGADGAESTLRGLAGLAVERQPYGQDALVLSAGLGRDHGGVARERFTDDGAIAVLPLAGRRAGLVWTLAHDHAETVAALSDGDRLVAIQDMLGQVLGRLHGLGNLVRYPLQRVWTPDTVAGRVVLIGNAAQSLHPIAAQGFNLGLRDALVLAEELVRHGIGRRLPDTQADGGDVFAALRRHRDRRQGDRERIAGLSHWLARWPKLTVPGSGLLRSVAFGALTALPMARESLALAAMGFADDAPALCLGQAA